MKIKRNRISKKRFSTELISIAKISASICFNEMLLREQKKSWQDLENELLDAMTKLKSKLENYRSFMNTAYMHSLIEFVEGEITNCTSVINKYKRPLTNSPQS